MGWDKQTNRWVMDGSAAIGNGSRGSGESFFTIGTRDIDRIIVQDCIARPDLCLELGDGLQALLTPQVVDNSFH